MVIFPISIFSQIRSEGGVIKYHFFPKFKIVHIILGGGGCLCIRMIQKKSRQWYVVVLDKIVRIARHHQDFIKESNQQIGAVQDTCAFTWSHL